MSRDGYLPDNVSEADFDRAFPPDCPDSCRSMQIIWSQCGGVDMCSCYAHLPHGTRWFWRLRDWLIFGQEICVPLTDNECDCPSAEEIAADRAEARADAEWD